MNNRRSMHHSLAAAAAGAIAATAACAQTYTITAIDPSPAAEASWAWDINNAGRVTGGFAAEEFSTVHGFYWDDGQTMDLPPYDPDYTRYCEAFAVNADGVVVGEATKLAYLGATTHGFVTTDGVAPTLLDPLPTMSKYQFNDVSDESVPWAAGWTDTGVLYSGMPMHQASVVLLDGNLNDPVELENLGGVGSWANAINRHGAVAGAALTPAGPSHAVLWIGGDADDLGTLGGRASEAVDINDANLVVGWADTADDRRHAMACTDGVMTDLGTLGGHTSEALGVNASGQIVGMSWTDSGRVHAFVYEDGSMIDLNSRVQGGSEWELQYAEAINDAGQIVGRGLLRGRLAAFVLTPSDGCTADCNSDGVVDTRDFVCFLNLWSSDDPDADCNADGDVNTQDFICFLDHWAGGC